MTFFSSKSSTEAVTNVTNRNVGADGGSIAAAEHSTVNVLDAGAIEAGLDFAGDVAGRAFNFTEDITGRAFDYSTDSNVRALEFSRESESLFYGALQFLTGQSAAQSRQVLNTATDAIERTVAVQTTTADERLTKVMTIFVVGGVAVAALFMLRGKKNGS